MLLLIVNEMTGAVLRKKKKSAEGFKADHPCFFLFSPPPNVYKHVCRQHESSGDLSTWSISEAPRAGAVSKLAGAIE